MTKINLLLASTPTSGVQSMKTEKILPQFSEEFNKKLMTLCPDGYRITDSLGEWNPEYGIFFPRNEWGWIRISDSINGWNGRSIYAVPVLQDTIIKYSFE